MTTHKQIFSKAAFKSPDLSKLKAVVIDHRTTIYIPQDADSDTAREKYLSKYLNKIIK